MSYLLMCIGESCELVEYVHGNLSALVNLVNCVLDNVLVILVHSVTSTDDFYLGEKKWSVNYMWFDDLFCDDDFLVYIFEMMNCICWVNYANWGTRLVILILIDVVKWWDLMMI